MDGKSENGAMGLAGESRYALRSHQAIKILAILEDFLGSQLTNMNCLDIGCGRGIISNKLAKHFKLVVGMDQDRAILQGAALGQLNNCFVIADGAQVPIPDGFFDVVICAQVYEHAAHQSALSKEIWRILRPGGVCFFSGPNRLAIIEEHYWLPFLSWLPQSLADRYMRLFRRGSVYDIKPLFYWQLRQLWRRFTLCDYTVRLIQEPHKFAIAKKLGRLKWVGRLPGWLLKLFLPLLPNYNWILIKP